MSDTGGCTACRADQKRAKFEPGYRRALWTVVVLNLGFGVIETAGGFIADSQALKADALDFLGDGLVTFVGLLALNWRGSTRTRVACAQGIFLGFLGLGVLFSAFNRVMQPDLPDGEWIGALGLAALFVNVAAAMALIRFRDTGDAYARAIWIYSRNDAIANLAVIAAAVLVLWLESGWPDLLVAGAIATLFVHSAWEILRRARKELTQGEPKT